MSYPRVLYIVCNRCKHLEQCVKRQVPYEHGPLPNDRMSPANAYSIDAYDDDGQRFFVDCYGHVFESITDACRYFEESPTWVAELEKYYGKGNVEVVW